MMMMTNDDHYNSHFTCMHSVDALDSIIMPLGMRLLRQRMTHKEPAICLTKSLPFSHSVASLH